MASFLAGLISVSSAGPVEEARAAFEGGEIPRPFFVASSHDDSTQRPMLAVSHDGIDFQRITPFNFTPPAGDGCRDCSLLFWKGRYYMTYTAGYFGLVTYFGIAVSDNLTDWTFLTNVQTGEVHTWAPEWCMDDNGVYITFAKMNSVGHWSLFYVKAANEGLTEWTEKSPVGGTEAVNTLSHIDVQVIRFQHHWLLVCRNYGGLGAHLFRSDTSPVEGYRLISRPNWGDTQEGQCLTDLGGGKLRLYFINKPGLPGAAMSFADTLDGGLTFGPVSTITGNYPAPHMSVTGFTADPLPPARLERTGDRVRVSYSSADNLVMETSTTLDSWKAVAPSFDSTLNEWWLSQPVQEAPSRFWRLRRPR